MIDYGRGYSMGLRVERIDPVTWAASESVPNALSVTIERSCTESVPLLETALLTHDGPLEDGWYRIAMIVDGSERVDLGTFLFEAMGRTYDRGGSVETLEGRSVLAPADAFACVTGEYAGRGEDGAQAVSRLLSECTPAPITVQGGFRLGDAVVFDIGMSRLAAAWKLLDAGGYCMQIAGDGSITILPMPTEPTVELSKLNASLVVPGVTVDQDMSSIPNRYYAIDNEQIAYAVNDDPDSPTSYQARGRWVDQVDDSPVRIDNENLQSYAQRKLAEASVMTRKISYSREWCDGVLPFSIVRGNLPEIGMDGDMRVLGQRLTIGNGVLVEETCGQEEALWS